MRVWATNLLIQLGTLDPCITSTVLAVLTGV